MPQNLNIACLYYSLTLETIFAEFLQGLAILFLFTAFVYEACSPVGLGMYLYKKNDHD